MNDSVDCIAVCSMRRPARTQQDFGTCSRFTMRDLADACRPHFAMQGLLICLLYVPSDMQDQNGQQPALWGQSFASVDLAQKQVLANAVGWSPPGTMLAALSTFTAALQDARADNKILLQVRPARPCSLPYAMHGRAL